MNLINAIRKEIENKNLNIAEESEQEKTKRDYNTLNLTNKYNFKRKALRYVNYDTTGPTKLVGAEGAKSNNEYLNNCRYFEDIANGVIVPYITANNVNWGFNANLEQLILLS